MTHLPLALRQRHPEVRAKRASKDDRPVERSGRPSRAAFGGHLRLTVKVREPFIPPGALEERAALPIEGRDEGVLTAA
jgi:hypothetical protein